MPKLKMTPFVIQALTAPSSRKGANYSTLSEPGKKILESILEKILKEEYSIYEYAWYFINLSLSNKNLAEVFDCLKETYDFTVTISKSSKYNHGLTERMKAHVVYALAFAGNSLNAAENKTLLPDMITCLKKHISIVEDAYFTVYKMIDRDNKQRTTPVDMKKLFTIQQDGDTHIAIFTYADITESGKGTNKKEAKNEACRNWLSNNRKVL